MVLFPFSGSTTFSFFSLPAFLPLSVMQRLIHSYIHTHIHSHPHIHVVLSLYPLHGFVLQPQWQGPGDEVILHRRAAGLTEPRPSPPSSSAQRTNSSLTSPSTVLLLLCSDKFTYMPMQTTGHAHKHHFSEVHISQAACLQVSADSDNHTSTSMNPHTHALAHTHIHR